MVDPRDRISTFALDHTFDHTPPPHIITIVIICGGLPGINHDPARDRHI